MATRSPTLLRYIRHLAEAGAATELSDRELVQRFADQGEEAAFASLVRRHGPMVLGVCQLVLGNEHDAEDVFQAVFLVLSRKAASLHRKEAVGPWLFGVARRLAWRARQQGQSRRKREELVRERPPGDVLAELTVREAQAVLDEELARLSERERAPLVLCYLQGLTRDEAAERLGCPLGTLKGRLERARALLQKRLQGRGLGLGAVLATLLLTGTSASAIPSSVMTAAVEAGVAYASGSTAGAVISRNAAALADWFIKSTLTSNILVPGVCVLMTATLVGLTLSASLFGSQPWREAQVDPVVAPLRERPNLPDSRPLEQDEHKNAGDALKLADPNEKARAVKSEPRSPVRFLDLQPHATLKLSESFAEKDNSLATLPTGEQTLSGVKFNIGEGLILLNHEERQAPRKIAGIKVDARFSRLHVLHATHWKKEDAVVGHYVLNYEDNSQEIIPIVCGKDLSNWWYHESEDLPSHAAVGWKGENAGARKVGRAKIRLYVASWQNPHPARKVATIDFSATRPDIAPFCVAMTVEE
jgi:RNA polymerase sigma factor (sigma-70 family)